ncbi:MAG: hypothetical protein QOE70_4400 [Chthoniobacter sp.]|jgi:hypothetical protein|nr:hypothetical protein [Chthoniobacter sp.]
MAGFVTLRHIVKPLKAESLFRIGSMLGWTHGYVKGTEGGVAKLPEQARTALREHLLRGQAECARVGLRLCAIHFAEIIEKLDQDLYTYESFGLEAVYLSANIRRELSAHRFFYLPSEVTAMYDSPRLFGEEVGDRFPSAHDDITEAGNCLATSRTTAAVFHLMRIAEGGVRAIWKALQTPPPTREDTWGSILDELEREAARPAGDRHPLWNEHFLFFEQIVADARMIKNVSRDATMHVAGTYNHQQAVQVYEAVRDFIQTVATTLDENGGLVPRPSSPPLPFSPLP